MNSVVVLLNSHLNWSRVIGGERQVRVASFAVQERGRRLMMLAQLRNPTFQPYKIHRRENLGIAVAFRVATWLISIVAGMK